MCFLGIFQCGPCPLKAIREGDVYLPFDSKFVYAEVNADKVYWLVKKVNGQNTYTKISTETRGVGMNLSTKAVGRNMRQDITMEYKYPEGDCPNPLKQCQRGDPWPCRSPHNACFLQEKDARVASVAKPR